MLTDIILLIQTPGLIIGWDIVLSLFRFDNNRILFCKHTTIFKTREISLMFKRWTSVGRPNMQSNLS